MCNPCSFFQLSWSRLTTVQPVCFLKSSLTPHKLCRPYFETGCARYWQHKTREHKNEKGCDLCPM
jgi:hypothetical protein